MCHIVWQQFPCCSGEKNQQNAIQTSLAKVSGRPLRIRRNKRGDFRPEFIGEEILGHKPSSSEYG
jgi:hypothetical protein